MEGCIKTSNTGKILFFDDNRINTEAAVEAGMKAEWVRDFHDLKNKFVEMGLIDKD